MAPLIQATANSCRMYDDCRIKHITVPLFDNNFERSDNFVILFGQSVAMICYCSLGRRPLLARFRQRAEGRASTEEALAFLEKAVSYAREVRLTEAKKAFQVGVALSIATFMLLR